MTTQLYETFSGDEITDDLLGGAAKLFSEHYGVWGEDSHSPDMKLHPSCGFPSNSSQGKPVKLSASRLRKQCLPNPSMCSYARVLVNGTLAGNAFACRWQYGSQTVCWVTQLVVNNQYRERGLATGLLRVLKSDGDDMYGIMTSHPAACLAAATSFGDFIKRNAKGVMEMSPIEYINTAKPRGSLLGSSDSTGLVSGVNSAFFVDHSEPLEALRRLREKEVSWPLGDLPDGHEYFVLVPAKRRRSRPRSSAGAKDH